jgi:hypothetical protein
MLGPRRCEHPNSTLGEVVEYEGDALPLSALESEAMTQKAMMAATM